MRRNSKVSAFRRRSRRRHSKAAQLNLVGGLPKASPPLSPGDRLLRRAEVLARVRHEKSWLYDKIAAKEFPNGHLIGRNRFWLESEVEEWLRRQLKP
jgi:predicted DNA-binding transcriptional regulator AlpA